MSDVDLVALGRLERQLDRARQERQILERMIEDKTRSLFLVQEELRESAAFLHSVLSSLTAAVIIADFAGRITSIGGATTALTGLGEADLLGRDLLEVVAVGDAGTDPLLPGVPAEMCQFQQEAELLTANGQTLPVLVTFSALTREDGEAQGTVCLATDVSERRRMEVELRHAHRLESIGQLAAGVAHEINTPIQYVGDSLLFLGDALADLMELQAGHERLRERVAGVPDVADLIEQLMAKEDEVDLEFVRAEAPKAVARTLEGIGRVASIVRAMKQFAHPAAEALAPVSLNELIETTLTVSRNEYRYAADVTCHLGEIPEVMCNRGDLGQVFINLIVNAGQAVGDRVAESGRRGSITIITEVSDGGVAVRISDTGGGIPEKIRERVFEPFFTTKEPGKGTGQGLALAHNLVVGKHGGRLSFEVDEGVGTTFTVWLPLRED